MLMFRQLPVALIVLVGLTAAPSTVRAAESYDNCTGTIESLPAEISTQGTWCLTGHLSTAMNSGAAITVSAPNVTVDCNDFKVGGLAAGQSSTAVGIHASGHQNVTVRQCAVRGFETGILLEGGSGHLVEDNRLDFNLVTGIEVSGENNMVQRNHVYDTGSATGSNTSYGIAAQGDVIDNTVSGVVADVADGDLYGIYLSGSGTESRNNRVRNLAVGGTANAFGIFLDAAGITVADNRISAVQSTNGAGIGGPGTDSFCLRNTVVNFATAFESCTASEGNLPANP